MLTWTFSAHWPDRSRRRSRNAQYFEQVELSLAETEARLKVSQALAEAQTEEAVLDAMIQVAGFNPQAEVSIYTAVEGKEGKVTVRRAAAFDSGIETKMQVGSQFDLCYVPLFAHISPEKPFVSNNLAEDEAVDPASRAMAEQIGLASIGLLPLMVGRTWLGFISMNSKVQGAFDDRVFVSLPELAEQGAAALQAARLRESLQITRTSVDQAQDAFFWFDDAGGSLM
jgi:GAF domain-containing protein